MLAIAMQTQTSTASRLWHGIKLFFKWLWLITMFLLGIALYLAMPFAIFEYSFSLSELDLIETLFIVFLVAYAYQYIKLCRRIDVPLVRKIITPWVHQAHVFLVFFLLLFASVNLFDFNLDDSTRMPLLDLFGYILTVATLGYSYYRVGVLASQKPKTAETMNSEGAVE
ncbi:hypothetical protein AB6C94_05770 [Vibrio splendidus]